MEFKEYTKGDLEKIWRRDLIEELGYSSEYILDPESTWTAYHDGQILGVGGFRKYWNGVYEAWLLARSFEDCYRHKLQVIKFIFDKMANLHFHRIQTSILVSSKVDIRFISFLGFHKEALLSCYGPKKDDYFLYSLVKN